MDSNDWSTINAGRDQALGREMEQLRRRYREHLDTLSRLAQSAPTEQLARRYDEIRIEINGAIERLNELERGGASSRATSPATSPGAIPAAGTVAAVAASATPPPPPSRHTERAWDAIPPAQPGTEPYAPESPSDRTGIRAIAIVAIGAVVLAILGVIGWRTLSHRGESGKVVEEPPAAEQPKIVPSDTTGTVVTPGSNVAPAASGLTVKPESQDYGTVRKGTRVVKKFEITNATGGPVTLAVSRSECHCLWFDYQSKLAAGAKTPLTVSLDGARAKKGAVNETVTVSVKEHPDEKVSFTLTANVQ